MAHLVTPQTFGLLYSTFAAVLTCRQGVQLSGGEVGKTDCVCLLFLTGRAVLGQRWRPIVSYLPAFVMNSSFQRRERVRKKQRAHNSFKFYCVPVAGCRVLACNQMQHTHSCTACSLQLNSLSLHPTHTQTLISPSVSVTSTHLFLQLSAPPFIPSLHPFPANSTQLALSFLLCGFSTTMPFVFRGHSRETLCLGRPCLLHVTLCASAVTSEGHYLPQACVCFGLLWT